MVLAHIFAGLGNQLFQYAAAHELAQRLGTEVRADLGWFEEKHRVPRSYLLPALGLAPAAATARERSHPYRRLGWLSWRRQAWTHLKQIGGEVPLARFRTAPKFVALSGYWQSEMFFPALKPTLARHLCAREPGKGSGRWLAAVRAPGTVALHVRRGDYVTEAKKSPHYRVLSADYYRAALRHLATVAPVRRLVVFSDDPAWCRAHLDLGLPLDLVERANPATSAADDLLCLAHARQLITANSTFSWWAAWIATQRGGARVVAPAEWFDDPAFAEWNRCLKVPGWHEL